LIKDLDIILKNIIKKKNLNKILKKKINIFVKMKKLLFFVFVIFYGYYKITSSNYEGKFVHSNNIYGQANIYRDENGIPHIQSKKSEEAYFALGIATA
jgi:acyl-homoserine lactone acylase PvdQ